MSMHVIRYGIHTSFRNHLAVVYKFTSLCKYKDLEGINHTSKKNNRTKNVIRKDEYTL